MGARLWDDPSLRASFVAAGLVSLCVALTLVGPLWLLLLAPLVFGVPHVASDLRYLVFAPPKPLPAGLAPGLLLVLGAMTFARASAMVGGPALPRVELALGALAVVMSMAFARQSMRTFALIGATLVLAAVALAYPRNAALLIGHAHNFVAVAIWFAWTRGRARWWAVGLLTVALGLVTSGVLDDWWFQLASSDAAGLTLTGMVAALAPDLPGPWGLRAVIAFALMQAVHYALWLGAIPATRARTQPSPPSRVWSQWVDDLGVPLMALTGLGTVVLLSWGGLHPTEARSSYLSLVLFHGWLELAVMGHLLARR